MGLAACDTGEPETQPIDAPPVTVLEVRATTVDEGGAAVRAAIAKDGSTKVTTATSFEVRLDRFLLPGSATRQSVCLASTTAPIRSLAECSANVLLEPTCDPALRRVTYRQRAGERLAPDTLYQLAIFPPTEDSPFGFTAFDGAPLAAPMQLMFRTAAADPTGTTDEAPLGGDLFCCGDAAHPCPIPGFGAATTFAGCAFSPCHAVSVDGALGASMGLNLSPPPAAPVQSFDDPIGATAINHVAHQTQTGELADDPALASEASRFGRAMALIRPGDPGNSYLLYKLAAEPANFPPGEAPSADEIARLRASVVVGMPMPAYGGTVLEGQSLELLSAWIAAGALTTPCDP